MSTVVSPRRRSRTRRDSRAPAPQVSLFAAVPAAVPRQAGPPEPAAVGSAEASSTASARRQGLTLDDVVVGAWEGLLAGAPAECPVCATPMAARHSAGAGVVGGRCGGCGSTLG
jgi:hypothetical protein